MVPDPTGRSLMTNPGRTRHVRAVTCTAAPPPTENQSSVVLGEEILIQTFELDCPAGADPHPMLNHEVGQFLAIEQDDTLG